MTFVLLYHDVVPNGRSDESGFPGPAPGRYKLDPLRFARHLDAIAAAGVDVGLLEPGREPAAALTFDDGGASAHDCAAALESRGWRGHFFVPTAQIGRRGFLDAPGVRELAERGHMVGSHSHSHPPYMRRLPPARLLDEWRRSREVLGDLLGRPPAIASLPGGSLSHGVALAAGEAGYRLLLTSEPSARRRRVGGLELLGRYAIRAGTPARRSAAYAAGARTPCALQWAGWTAKKAAKAVSAAGYERLRAARR